MQPARLRRRDVLRWLDEHLDRPLGFWLEVWVRRTPIMVCASGVLRRGTSKDTYHFGDTSGDPYDARFGDLTHGSFDATRLPAYCDVSHSENALSVYLAENVT